MSTISSSSSGLSQFFQNVNGTARAANAQPANADTSTPKTHHGHHHHTGGTGADAGGDSQTLSAIQQAVSTALQSAGSNTASGDTDPTATTTDPNQIVEQAIASVLKQTGTPFGASANSSSARPTGADPDNDGDTHSANTSAAASPQSSQRSAFFNLLQQSGIDPKQFHADFLAAVKDVQAGASPTSSTTSAFQSIPPGLAVDAAA